MNKLELKFLQADKGNSQDIYINIKLRGIKKYFSRQESYDKKYVQWGVTSPFRDGYSSGFENEYPLSKDILLKTDKGIEKVFDDDGMAEKCYKFSWEE